MSTISSIDDLLAGVGNSQQPATPEHKDQLQDEAEHVEETEQGDPQDNTEADDAVEEVAEENEQTDEEELAEKPGSDESDEDDYGNPKERMSKGMKERLDRKEKQHQREIEQRDHEMQVLRQQLVQQGANPQVQQAAKDFKYDPNDDASWQQQLTDFVKHTVNNMTQETQQKEQQVKEQQIEREFHQKFNKGMERFGDFREIVGSQPIDNAMTIALRAMNDPSAFIYAASKRHPQELERISKIPDGYARMVEMGKLEERMRRNKPTTQAPRPLGRTREDATTKPPVKEKDTSGDDLLAKADAKRLSVVKSRHKGNR